MIFLLPVLAPIVSGIASGLTITASAAEIAAVATVVTATGAATAEVIKAAKDKKDEQVAKRQVCGQPGKNREKKPVAIFGSFLTASASDDKRREQETERRHREALEEAEMLREELATQKRIARKITRQIVQDSTGRIRAQEIVEE